MQSPAKEMRLRDKRYSICGEGGNQYNGYYYDCGAKAGSRGSFSPNYKWLIC